MPAALTTVWGRLSSVVRGFSVAQRTIAIIGVAVLALGIFAVSSWIAKPALTPLFSGLAGQDASAIVDQLQANNVPYELTDGGSTILVPQDVVYDERLKAAAAGLPGSAEGGYSLLDTMGMTSSEFQQTVTYKRAIEGELATTISSMDGITAASVQLAIPEETVFVSERVDPTASVFIETRRGASLSTDQVEAIVHLTSAAVENMKPLDVAVIDSGGAVLSAVGVGVSGAVSGASGDRQEQTRESVQAMLDRLVGVGNSSVVVAVEVNDESGSRTEETFSLPEGAPALNEAIIGSGTGGAGAGGASGVLGPDNIAVPDATDTAADDADAGPLSTTRTNAVNKVTESTTIPAGAIQRQTVSVALDDGTGVDAAEVSDLVAAAAGLDIARGDEVVVKVVAFDTSAADAATAALAEARAVESAQQMWSLARTGLIALVVITAIITVLFLLRGMSRRAAREKRESIELSELHDMLHGPTIQMASVPSELETTTQFGELATTPLENPPTAGARSEIDRLADADPESTAEILRSMMQDRQRV